MDNFQIRTDLALEARESVNEEESKLRGVSVEEHYEEEADLRITKAVSYTHLYCFRDEGCHVIYHRFLPEDYAELMKA